MARPRGGNGSLRKSGQRNPVWSGDYREYVHSVKGGVKGVHRVVTLGRCREMTQAQAAKKLKGIIDLATRKFEAFQSLRIGSGYPRGKDAKRMVGAIAEMSVCLDLLRRTVEVYQAVNPLAPVDLVAFVQGQAFRVEVKAGRLVNGHASCDFGRNLGNFDILAIAASDGTVVYRSLDGKSLVPVPALPDRNHEHSERPLPEGGFTEGQQNQASESMRGIENQYNTAPDSVENTVEQEDL